MADRASKSRPGPPLSSRSGSATGMCLFNPLIFPLHFLVDVVRCFVASALSTGVACHCLQLQIQMGLVIG